jgi:UDP-glucose 4-epimerase
VPEYGGNLRNLAGIEDSVRVNISDVRDEHSMAYLVRGHDYLFNLAGQTSHLDSMQDPFTDLEINGRSQLSILESCRKFNPDLRIVFASTRQVYGRPQYLPVDEKHPLTPVDVNGINKLAGEWYHLLYNDVYGIPTCALRLTNTYGPRMRVKDARQTFLGIWVRSVVEGKPFQVWGGSQLRDFTFVDDAVDALLRAAVSDDACGKVFNVGGSPPASLRDVADLLVKVAGAGTYEVREFPPDRKQIDIGSYYSDDRLMRKTLGWSPRWSLGQGLEATVEYYRANLEYYC